jgi:hypothetical protein
MAYGLSSTKTTKSSFLTMTSALLTRWPCMSLELGGLVWLTGCQDSNAYSELIESYDTMLDTT